jgi:hypothetical protein
MPSPRNNLLAPASLALLVAAAASDQRVFSARELRSRDQVSGMQGAPRVNDDAIWNRRPAGAGNYQIVMEVSGRAELTKFLAPPADPQDLQSICDARREAWEIAVPTTEKYVASVRGSSKRGGGGVPPVRNDVAEIAWTERSLGQLHAYDGNLGRAAEYFDAARRLLIDSHARPGFADAISWAEAAIGVAHLRRGELENCIDNHHATSCIFPIDPAGRHGRPSGSQMAIDSFGRHLARHPDNLEIRWLLNVAYMTLGKYPDGVPKPHLIPPHTFASPEDAGRFIDVAHEIGLDDVGRAGGAVVEDFDNDGWLDVVISSVDPCASLRYFRNTGRGTFTDVTKDAALESQLGGINLVQADYDNDGWIDLFVMRGGWEFPMRNSLLRNEQGRRFVDVTKQAGLSSGVHRTHSAAWADFDNDGWLDLFVGHEESSSALFRNQHDGTFRDVGRTAGVTRSSFIKGATWGDYDADGYPDLYVSNYGSENFLFHNEQNGTFTERAAALGVARPVMSFPTWFFDYDNDGRLDLLVVSYVPSVTEVVRALLRMPRQAETMKLYRNTGSGFEDVTAAQGLERVVPTMGANFGDIDNDGFLDFYLGTGAPSYAAIMPNVLYRNRGGKGFVDVTTPTGTGHLQKGHGVAFGDVDNDGDQDLYSNIGGFVPGDVYHRVLFRNPGHGNNWIRVKLVGVKSNRAGVGARIRIDVEGGTRYREVTSGGSFGASSFTQHIGLGKAKRIKRLEVWWPATNTRQAFEDQPVNRMMEIREFQHMPL